MKTICEETLLLTCEDCGKPFFTEGEKNFYESKRLNFPKRCKDCRDAHRKLPFPRERTIKRNTLSSDTLSLYDEIIDNWSVEAKKENKAYFCNVKEVNTIMKGKQSFVIGRKGSGKTAIARHLYELEEYNIFAEKLSFKNFPFNILYSLENCKEYTAPNQYISIWKYLIYTCICKMMIKNKNINSDIQSKLIKIYGDSDSAVKSLERLIEKWTSKSFGAEIFGLGFSYEREKLEQDITWIDAIEILQQVILEHCDLSKYFIVFDELDEDYKDFSSVTESENYMCMLTSLFKAVQDVRCIFDKNSKHILPVVFLRSDIYARLKYSDKNKWQESVINMEWDRNQIQQMLAHRLCVASQTPDTDFDTVWHMLFAKQMVNMGHRQTQKMNIFDYIERSTEMRPRDFIQYVKECVKIAKEKGEYPISQQTVKDADDNFSEYLKGETIDEIFAVMPEANEILGLLSTIRKQSFQFNTFEVEYNRLVERKVVEKRDVKGLLLILFDAGVIGNQPSMRGQTIFKFSKKSPRFNFNETMVVHRGLYKALQIF